LEVSIAAFKVSEWEMSRQHARLQPEDVVVADSAYGTYVDLLVQAAKADAVFRKHHARHCDFRRGKSWVATISSPGSVPTMSSVDGSR